jgi:hypothetical protein
MAGDITASMYGPITLDELKFAMARGARNKSPGFDWIIHEFYVTHWDIIKGELL